LAAESSDHCCHLIIQRLRFIQFLPISDCKKRVIPQQLGPPNRAIEL